MAIFWRWGNGWNCSERATAAAEAAAAAAEAAAAAAELYVRLRLEEQLPHLPLGKELAHLLLHPLPACLRLIERDALRRRDGGPAALRLNGLFLHLHLDRVAGKCPAAVIGDGLTLKGMVSAAPMP